jgi:DNA-binding NarL/FixJ family response regulator
MSNPKDKDFKKLQDKWYKKLEKSRFEDIEQDENLLKKWSSKLSLSYSHEEIAEKQKYFTMAEEFLNQYKFASKRDRIIWEYHCNGLSIREIADTLKKVRIKIKKSAVQNVVQRLKIKMFDLLWVPLKEYHE